MENMLGINPTVRDYFEANKSATMLGFFWSMYWRFAILVWAIWFGLWIVFGIFTAMFS